jgi:hypothetical protein
MKVHVVLTGHADEHLNEDEQHGEDSTEHQYYERSKTLQMFASTLIKERNKGSYTIWKY